VGFNLKVTNYFVLFCIRTANALYQIELHTINLVTMSYKFKAICLKFSLIAGSLLLLQTIYAQKNFSELEKAVEAQKTILGNDLVVIIANADSITYQKEYGNFNNKTQAPIASSGKWLTAALIMQLVDEGKISLDDKISKYLPVFESYGKNYITIRHCLSHQTGIQGPANILERMFDRKKFNTLDEEVTEFAKKEIQNNPGLDFRYNNMGLNIAGRIAEVVTKKKFDALIKLRLFTPLGMRNTTFSTLDGTAPNPSGGAKSTAVDYTKFLQMLLNNGKFGGKQILSEASVAELKKVQVTKEQIKYAPKAAEGFTYALGSWVEEGSGAIGGSATTLACPGLFGTWPLIDFSRSYACVFFVKNLLSEQKADAYLKLKKIIDKQYNSK
jgi:CubicO group peptidase (beta-lactamase class C family)